MSEEDIPRRMRRFHRDEIPTEYEVKDRSTEIAINEVDKFKGNHSRYPQQNELDQISESVFKQLKEEMRDTKETKQEIASQLEFEDEEEISIKDTKGSKKSYLERRRTRRMHGKPEEEDEIETAEDQPEKGKEELEKEEKMQMPDLGEEKSIPDLLENEKLNVNADQDRENLKKLTEIDELGSLENDLKEIDDFDLVEKETETSENTCPNCNNKTKEFIYCPNCGQAFCDHCAKQVQVQEESIKYTCPNCSNEFKKRKKPEF